ncbi:MAG: hypothetical protein KBS57_00120 [Alistipes sp.]|nr:hypothetical protein [Candidatus Minthomonas equi]
MKLFLSVVGLVALSVFLLCFNVIFRKKPFPDGEISRNKELRKRGIVCANEEEVKLHGKRKKISAGKCDPDACIDCVAGCGTGTEKQVINK